MPCIRQQNSGLGWQLLCLTVAAWAGCASGLLSSNGLPQWETVFPQHVNREYLVTRPRTRYSHTMTVVGNELVVAFGYFYDHHDGGEAQWEADVWSISASWWLITSKQAAQDAGEPHPQARMNHIAVARQVGVDDHRLVIFGGTDVQHEMMNDLWELDVRTQLWEPLIPSPGQVLPPPRNCFSAALLNSRLFIFGGFHLGDLWRYNFKSRKWKLMIDKPMEDSPNHPGVRSSHAAVTAPNGKDMYVLAGFRFENDVPAGSKKEWGKLNDLWLYKYDANQWELVPQVNSRGAREYMTMELAPWRLAGEEHMGLVTFAGVKCDPNCSLRGSIDFFSLRDKNWHDVNVANEPLARYQHGMVLHADSLWTFGGESYDPHMYHNAVLRFPWPPEGSEALSAEL